MKKSPEIWSTYALIPIWIKIDLFIIYDRRTNYKNDRDNLKRYIFAINLTMIFFNHPDNFLYTTYT